jgi:putative Ca2+/H+ antiporter (TMEM165/GDT1 family)
VDAFFISFGIIFAAELGDKSQLMAMTFAARYKAVTILIAISAASQHLGARLSERTIKSGAAALFAVFGIALIVEGVR